MRILNKSELFVHLWNKKIQCYCNILVHHCIRKHIFKESPINNTSHYVNLTCEKHCDSHLGTCNLWSVSTMRKRWLLIWRHSHHYYDAATGRNLGGLSWSWTRALWRMLVCLPCWVEGFHVALWCEYESRSGCGRGDRQEGVISGGGPIYFWVFFG